MLFKHIEQGECFDCQGFPYIKVAPFNMYGCLYNAINLKFGTWASFDDDAYFKGIELHLSRDDD